MAKVLVTGGAGFIGSFIVDELVARGHEVRILDNLEPQVHGPEQKKPDYLNPEAEFVFGDICDRELFKKCLEGVEVVFHEAAGVGVGQSMYQVLKYVRSNSLGIATLLDIVANGEAKSLKKMIIPSSMSIYGEGAYSCPHCGLVYPTERTPEMLEKHQWEPVCPKCGADISPIPVTEDKPLVPTSVYAVTKRDHEELSLSVGKAYGVSTFALRYFNVYGSRQALSNPYTGVAAIFCGNLLRGSAPGIFEDGHQKRDFIHISDIVSANMACMDEEKIRYGVYNVGSGDQISILELAKLLAKALKVDIDPVIVEKFRVGDIRHCFADLTKIKNELGWEPKVKLEDGVQELIQWVAGQTPEDQIGDAMKELLEKGLAQ